MTNSTSRFTIIAACFALAACGPEPAADGTWVAIPSSPPSIVVQPEPRGIGVSLAGSTDVVLRNVASRSCLDVPRQTQESRTLLWTWECNGTAAQKWTLTSLGHDGYRLTSRASGKCLDVPHASSGSNITLWQFDCNGTPAQSWDLERSADGTFLVRSRASSLCLDVPHGQATNGVGVQQYPCHGGAPQRWILVKA